MKINLLSLLVIPAVMYSQNTEKYPNTFSSGSTYVKKFDNKSRLFNDWSISVGGGGAFMQSADLTSFYGKGVNLGWNTYISLDKQISHVFGLSLQYQQGQTNQQGMINPIYGVANANTKYKQVSLIGDVNFSNLLLRVDNNSTYRWALHGYAGLGLQGYKTYLQDKSALWNGRGVLEVNQDLDIASFFYQAGAGIKYKISKLLDIEARLMYIMSGDDEFDGGGWDNTSVEYPYNRIKNTNSDNMFTANLGLTFKLGKHLSHLAWHDPLEYLENRISKLGAPIDFVVCEKGDNDNDGVCDDWDRQLDTPAGARVDGAGVALDIDLDGVIDLYDKCVTVPGPASNNGCPEVLKINVNKIDIKQSVVEINKNFEGIEFDLNSDVIRSISFDRLDKAAAIIKSLDSKTQYLVIGATDTRGSAAYNKKLSQRRADAVVKYLVDKGVDPYMLLAEGRGKDDLKYPECNPYTKCPEWKNEANRRVYFSEK
ncbi:OmpA family protein [Riemerella anatipestifer]|uniref:OmpA family protein n=1 Tax=Riemerella anatipestifer TaxID=34085 RepID=UPI0012AEB11E|nr:OmpA family protein [Riemerella anatipestifer]USL94981.1 OmpA family protein [Riemerella anatipestifer]